MRWTIRQATTLGNLHINPPTGARWHERKGRLWIPLIVRKQFGGKNCSQQLKMKQYSLHFSFRYLPSSSSRTDPNQDTSGQTLQTTQPQGDFRFPFSCIVRKLFFNRALPENTAYIQCFLRSATSFENLVTNNHELLLTVFAHKEFTKN